MQTLTGIDFMDIQKALNKPLPSEAYSAIPHGVMAGKTDIDPRYVRDRLDEVFGPNGAGWWIAPTETGSYAQVNVEIRKARSKNGGEYEQTWYVVDLVNYQLCYRLTDPETHEYIICKGSALTDSSDNMERNYAQRGAETSLMKQAYAVMGGMNHVYYGEFTHREAQATPAGKSATPNGKPAMPHADPNVVLSNDKARAVFFAEVKAHGMSPEAAMKKLKELGHNGNKLTHGQAIAILFPAETEESEPAF